MAISELSDPNTESHLDVEARIEALNYPYQDREVLEGLYHDRELSQEEVADKLGCSQQTVSYWMDRLKIDTRNEIEAIKVANSKPHTTYRTNDNGYEEWLSTDPDGVQRSVYVHQLLAINEGYDPSEVFSNGHYHCHHKNEVKWDNRPSNLQFVTAKEHIRIHNTKDDND